MIFIIINDINIINNGYVYCKSAFYSAQDILNNSNYTFTVGTNKLIGEIDSGIWAVSYLLSMYKYKPKDFILFELPKATVNNEYISLDELSKFSCYMDRSHPLFSTKSSVKSLVSQGLKKSKLNYSPEDIQNIFCIDNERFERPLTGVGNEIFKAMAAIGYSNGKQIFCFPWLSQRRFDGFHANITGLLQILENLETMVIVPLGVRQR